MITSYLLTLFILAILAIVGITCGLKINNVALGVSLTILGMISTASFFIFAFAAGLGGECGYNTYKEYATTDFTKALATDHSSVTIIHNGTPFIFKDYNVVHNFHSITNILIYERTSVLGCTIEKGFKIVTPNNANDGLLDNAEN